MLCGHSSLSLGRYTPTDRNLDHILVRLPHSYFIPPTDRYGTL
jgi:hypothetical protein